MTLSDTRGITEAAKQARNVLTSIHAGLIVSCQAPEGSPLRHPVHMAAMAQAAEMAGAVGIRANGPEFVRAIRAVTDLPIIGIDKRSDIDPVAYITPHFESVVELVRAGADIIAIDGTSRPRTGTGAPSANALLRQIRSEFGNLPVMADVSNVEEGMMADESGFDLVATTLSGYTGNGQPGTGPDIELVARLVKEQSRPVIAEGRFATPEQVVAAYGVGAHSVVVGTAITDTLAIARRFAEAVARKAQALRS